MAPQHQGLTAKPSLPVLDSNGAPVLDEKTGEPKTRRGRQTWSGVVRMVPSVLGERIPKPRDGGRRRVFVNSMSDWFHPEMLATEERRRFIAACFAWMYSQPWCDFQLLTKRPKGLEWWLVWLMTRALESGLQIWELLAADATDAATMARRMKVIRKYPRRLGIVPLGDASPAFEILPNFDVRQVLVEAMESTLAASAEPLPHLEATVERWRQGEQLYDGRIEISWPPRNVMFGVTAENQRRADERLPIMAELKRLGLVSKVFVSYEPALGPVDFSPWLGDTIDWLICGGESGARARPMHPDWARAARDQVLASRTPFLFKQWGSWRQVAGDDCDWTHIIAPSGRVTRRGREAPVSDWASCAFMRRANKKTAGSELDGRRWLEFPVLVGDATTAYTIGRAENYDRCLLELGEDFRKTGKGDRLRGEPEYPGGIVWQTAEEATAAAPEGFAAYELELPGPWRECVYEVDGGHHLLPEALIVGRV